MNVALRLASAPIADPTPAPAPAPTPAPPADPVERFDLSHIDTPTEALCMPIVDLVAGMAAGNGDTPSVATVALKSGDQSLQYTIRPSADRSAVRIEGQMNAQPFTLDGAVQGTGVGVQGATPGGALAAQLEVQAGGFKVSGQAGDVPFEETLTLNPFAALTGNVATIEGKIGGEALQESLAMAPDGQSLLVTGSLGARAIEETVTQGAAGGVLIRGHIGAVVFEETIDQQPLR